ncbi:hypothetical protein KEM09_02970 [Carboxylicivirga mesophila]|uniref:Outer membrane protein beta-barrel domain-containing protein n=1 Tax=Carboxylicivirga mesophila TaxID=1166478 RepID=A0ABS5K602_9BACT|nr:hypothetical protein [Carboxylicivirga mesophila]MBS2210342.1 hypothetical protein [Carboxylicivirga mesophila]
MPKGQWMTGGTLSYQTNDQNNFKFLFIENWEGSNYSFRVTPYFMYTFRENTGVGGKFSYKRTFNKIKSFNIKIDDNTSLTLKDYESVSHMFYSTAFLRNYLAIGESRRFGLYVDTELSYGFGQSKIVSGKGADLNGTYETINELQIGVVPGLCAFINNNVALEVSVDVVGISFRNIDQEFNRIDTGSLTTSGANFKIDLFSIKFGVSIYI